MKLIAPAAAFAVALATGGALLAMPAILAAEEAPQDVIERIMPQLMGQDDAVRKEAESELLDLGEPGRVELERISRERDPRRAITALRLLQNPGWDKPKLKDGEVPARPVQRLGDRQRSAGSGNRDLEGLSEVEEFRARIERQMEKQFEELSRRFREIDQGFEFSFPELGTAPAQSGRSSGSVVENDRLTSWTVEDDGHIKVTVKDGKEAAEETFEAPSLEALKNDHPDVGARVEKHLPRARGRGGFTFRFGRDGLRGAFGARPGWEDLDDERFDGRGAPQDRQIESLPQAQVLGIEWSPTPNVLREQLQLGEDDGIVVESVVPGSLAAKLGLARFDILLQLGSRPVAGAADVRSTLDMIEPGQTVSAVFIRKGQRKSAETVR